MSCISYFLCVSIYHLTSFSFFLWLSFFLTVIFYSSCVLLYCITVLYHLHLTEKLSYLCGNKLSNHLWVEFSCQACLKALPIIGCIWVSFPDPGLAWHKEWQLMAVFSLESIIDTVSIHPRYQLCRLQTLLDINLPLFPNWAAL